MESKKEVRPGNPIKAAGITFIPVAEVLSGYRCYGKGFALLCLARLTSVVVVSQEGKRAIGMDGEDVSLSQLTEEVPGLKEILDGA